MLVSPACATLAQVALLRGALRDAAEHAERARVEPASSPDRPGPNSYAWTRARIAEARDGPVAAMPILDEEYARLPTRPALLVEEASAASWLTRVALTAGDRARAASVAACAGQLAAGNPELVPLAAAARHCRGLLDRDAAEIELAAAGYRHPWAAASAHEDAGVVLAARGDHEAARGTFEQSLTAYERAGAERDAARLRSRLRALGIRPTHWTRADRPVTGWRSLTATERRVAAVIAEGLTNAEAAARLFLSRHTVDYHLRKVFRKLGVRSRSELTRLVVECDEQLHAGCPAHDVTVAASCRASIWSGSPSGE
jgi:DNA-binding CsgD family transcriptional regulator